MSSGTPLLPFAQLEVPGRAAIADGRYLVRPDADAEPSHVLIVRSLGVPRASGRRRKGKAQPVEGYDAEPLPLGRYTVARPKPFADPAEAARWLKESSEDTERADRLLDEATLTINRAIHAQRAAGEEAGIADVSPATASTRRIGFGTGDELADGRWGEAVEMPQPQPRGIRDRLADLAPQEQVAAVLGGRGSVLAAQTLLLRARSDLDQGRGREAALQLVVGLDALLAEVQAAGSDEQTADLAAATEMRPRVGAAASAALRGNLDADGLELVAEALATGERVIRRRRFGVD